LRKEAPRPVDERRDAVRANVAIEAVDLGRARHAKAIDTEPARDDFRVVVEEADPGGRVLALFVVETDGDRIALHRIDVDVIAQHAGERAALHARAHDDLLENIGASFSIVAGVDGEARVATLPDRLDLGVVAEFDAVACAGLGETASELVDVAGRIRRREEAAMKLALQCGLDAADFVRADRMAVEPAFAKQLVDLRGGVVVLAVLVDVQDAAPFQIELDALALGNRKEMFARGEREAHGLDGVRAVVRDLAQEFAHPRILVPRGRRIHEERGVAREHPAQAFQHGGRAVPDFGVADGELAAVRERCFHRRIAMTFVDGNLEAAAGEGVSGRDAGNPGADDGDS
jgi:hypothetical protein